MIKISENQTAWLMLPWPGTPPEALATSCQGPLPVVWRLADSVSGTADSLQAVCSRPKHMPPARLQGAKLQGCDNKKLLPDQHMAQHRVCIILGAVMMKEFG